MQPGIQGDNALRTRVYIDGYNLYYGCLKNTPYKWLDVRALVERILAGVLYRRDGVAVRCAMRCPAIKFFTAPILSAFARSDDSVFCQVNYHAALQAHLGAQLEIVAGYHDARPARAYRWIEGRAARECEMIEIWKLEEKQSDVSLALHAFSDAVRREVDHVIAITNDSDFVPAMKMIREHTDTVLGLIVPTVKGSNGAARKWLNQPCEHLGGRVPILMCESPESAAELRAYMDQYAREFRV